VPDASIFTDTHDLTSASPQHVPAKWLFYTGLLGMLAALVTGIGEFFLLYAPELNHGPANNFANFLHPSEADLHRGYYIGAIGAPFYIIGYWHIVGMLKLHKTKLGWAIMSLAVFGFMLGLVWLLSNAYQGLLVQAIAANSGDAAAALTTVQNKVEHMSDPLLQVIRFQVMIMSALLAICIFKFDTYYKRWVALFTPFVLILLVFSTLLFMRPIGKYFVPEALNVAHFIFFTISTIFAFKAYKKTA